MRAYSRMMTVGSARRRRRRRAEAVAWHRSGVHDACPARQHVGVNLPSVPVKSKAPCGWWMNIAQPLGADEPLDRRARAVRRELVAALAVAHRIGRALAIELRAALAEAEQRALGSRNDMPGAAASNVEALHDGAAIRRRRACLGCGLDQQRRRVRRVAHDEHYPPRTRVERRCCRSAARATDAPKSVLRPAHPSPESAPTSPFTYRPHRDARGHRARAARPRSPTGWPATTMSAHSRPKDQAAGPNGVTARTGGSRDA